MLDLSTNILERGVTRRRFVLSLTASLGFCRAAVAAEVRVDGPSILSPDVVSHVTPSAGVNTGISFGDSILRLIAGGALDPAKLRSLSGRLPDWVERLFAAPSMTPILFSYETAPYLVNLLWPLGLSTRTAFNRKSPIYTLRIPDFASTGGWTLGREKNGYVYFNKIDAVTMTDQQEAMVLNAATKTYRPCCDNSTFFQDCNHGSALLGLMELAASQGATAARLYQIALAANSYWFPEEYAKTALYFWRFQKRSWSEIPPPPILSRDFSSLSGWTRNVNDRLRETDFNRPSVPGEVSACGI